MPTEVTQSDEDHEAAEVTANKGEDDLERSRFRTQNIPGQSNGLKLYFRLRPIKENDGHEMVFKSSGLRIQVLRNGDPAEPDLYGINIPTSLRGFISLNERREVRTLKSAQFDDRYFQTLAPPPYGFCLNEKVSPLLHFDRFTKSSCMIECFHNVIKELCHCYTDEIPSHHPPAGYKLCNKQQLEECARPLLFKAKLDLDQGKNHN